MGNVIKNVIKNAIKNDKKKHINNSLIDVSMHSIPAMNSYHIDSSENVHPQSSHV